jgi:thioester reductase-like protein
MLLTGATGYLGAPLRSLIGHTAATVHCLVRGHRRGPASVAGAAA